MENFIYVIIAIFVIPLVIYYLKNGKNPNPSRIEIPQQRYSFSIHNYYGGYDDIMDIKQIGIGYDIDGYFYLMFLTQEKKIPIEDIIDIFTRTEQQLKEEVSLGRFLLVGALAFLWKKNKVTNKKFVIISYLDKEDNKKRDIIIESRIAEMLYSKLNNVFKEYKQKQNINQNTIIENVE